MLKLQQISLIAFQAVLTRPGERLQMWVKRRLNVAVFMVAAPKMGKTGMRYWIYLNRRTLLCSVFYRCSFHMLGFHDLGVDVLTTASPRHPEKLTSKTPSGVFQFTDLPWLHRRFFILHSFRRRKEEQQKNNLLSW